MAFPKESELKKIRKVLKNAPATRIVGLEGTKLEKLKFKICQNFLTYLEKKKITQKDLALLLEVDEAIVSKILRCRIESFSLDRLLRLYEIIYPNYKIEFAS